MKLLEAVAYLSPRCGGQGECRDHHSHGFIFTSLVQGGGGSWPPKIATHAQSLGENPTAIPGLALYRRTTPTACLLATYEPSVTVFVQGRKRVNLGGDRLPL